jgi:esterase/lipase superfamily enzyme
VLAAGGLCGREPARVDKLKDQGVKGLFLAAVALLLAGCASTHSMMATPSLYTGPGAKPLFTDTSVDAHAPALDLLFITDRAPATDEEGGMPYTSSRARSMAFGSTTIEFGNGVTWDALAEQSVAAQRTVPVDLKLGTTTELGRFPPIPYEIVWETDGVSRAPAYVEAHAKAKQSLQAEIVRRLAVAPTKEVVLFVHGYHATFERAALTMGELCHFLGRQFVCGVFSWPAGGRRGILFGYNVDVESGEFAIEHLLKTIRIIADTPGVERVHLLAHSRGTNILASALSELSVEAYMRQHSLAQQYKIGNVILVAPDLDIDVAPSKILKVFSDPDLPFGPAPDARGSIAPSPQFKVTIYASHDDKALATSTWLFGSIGRLGRLETSMLRPDQIEKVRTWGFVDFIEVRGTTDFFGHAYFITNPRVSGDIVALLRYGLAPNQHGRPLEEVTKPFWRLPTDASAPRIAEQ